MTSLLEGAKKLVTRGTDIGVRIDGLDRATEAARGRLDDEPVADARAVVDRASGRLRLSADHTVVAIAGATGSGKSSTFNALTGLELSAVGVRRPTTSWATACVWGREGADELLEWLGIPPRHQTTRDSMLDTKREDNAMQGVVLLDLPDHDSTEVAHHLEVDRLVQLADLLVWVLDPQKYADAAIHDRYLAPLATHQGVMVVVLNHIDTVPADRRQSMVDDVRRLLDADGLPKVPVIPISAREGIGLDDLRGEIQQRVSAKKMTRARLEADLKAAASRMQEASGTGRTRALPRERVAALEDAFAEAAGVPTVVDAVERSTRLRAGRATGWPVTSWLSRLRPDPLRRLHLDLGADGKQLTGRSRTSMPQTTQVQRARVDTEVRMLADEVSEGLARPWAESVRRASVARLPDLGDRLDGALSDTELGVARMPVWAGAVRLLQWLLIIAALAGAVWLGTLAVLDYLQMSAPGTPDVGPLPVPTVLLLGGIGLGIVLALVCRLLVRATARRRARRADARLREAVRTVAQELVVDPVEAELTAYTTVREGLGQALR
ncbi:GTPase Era involved in 16S rRNA processing [Nocardioides ginsengisegetis]|uniref:GTPase Era involved in 16S rRNA processing n=1 Tax=Nocardioides ginsengisegetis TaxID=661491 RepID=A0A7W3J146_9ACTN|nr:GTPase [Nocardioides ginsengisegetis]MBA8804322.1 GTPase Era involved in 16S rRNA processing [Nocardioides ginsengisegetis]